MLDQPSTLALSPSAKTPHAKYFSFYSSVRQIFGFVSLLFGDLDFSPLMRDIYRSSA